MKKAQLIASLDRPYGGPAFKPVKVQKPKPELRHIGYACDPEKYEALKSIAQDHDVTLKQLLQQMVEFAIANMGSAK